MQLDHIVIIDGRWTNHLPMPMRADMVTDIYVLAVDNGWEIRTPRVHWPVERRTLTVPQESRKLNRRHLRPAQPAGTWE